MFPLLLACHRGQMHGLRAAVWANTSDIRAHHKDRVRVDVVWNQESYVGF